MAAMTDASELKQLNQCKESGENGVVWTSGDQRLLAAAFLVVLATVTATYYWQPLLPAFEQDRSMAWHEDQTRQANTYTQIAEGLGLLFAGPLADHCEGRLVLTLYGCVAIVGMFLSAASHEPKPILALTCLTCFSKAVVWPTVSATISANIHSRKHDTAFLFSIMASRSADAIGALLYLMLLGVAELDWRGSARVIAGLAAAIFLCASNIAPEQVRQPADCAAFTPAAWWEKFARMVRCPNGWIALTSLFFSGLVWSMAAYTPLLLVDMFEVDAALAAGGVSALPVGMLLGLCIAAYASQSLSVASSRTFQIVLTIPAIVALVLLAVRPSSYDQAMILLVFVGIGSVVPVYMPAFVYVASSPPTDRAFRHAVINGLSLTFGTFVVDIFGTAREAYGHYAGAFIFGSSAVGLLIGSLCMAALYTRLAHADTPPMQSMQSASTDEH
eukprot:TRINITY_DN80218_c0_g1_i1.p1 TRINITY_DN80218_c0_g1~~TRINITY_DN80218_c0_g1_i1.p1  ORF type:complete len:445 (-),score=36.89 TRINITY_DN80218_c0_g1_i1:46-1380(-)